jgi:16S rRNA (guanine(966)-N(2))-methyltransferase RsmD
MRIIAGLAKGRRLVSPQGLATRPMTDRAREGLFSSLGPLLVDAAVMDLFAGSGSLGLEALSRGAAEAVFVERERKALGALRRNIAAVGLGGRVVAGDVYGFLSSFAGSVDLVFVDPPYDLALPSVAEVLTRIVESLESGGTVVVHRRRGEEPPAAPGLMLIDRRTYGDAELFRLTKDPRPTKEDH